MARANIVKVDGLMEIKSLVNPFNKGDIVKIPSGSSYTTTHPNSTGRELSKRNQSVKLFSSFGAVIDRYFNTNKRSRSSATIYSSERQHVLVTLPSVSFAGTGGYWKHIELTAEIIAFNGLEPEYKVIGEFGEDGRFRDERFRANR